MKYGSVAVDGFPHPIRVVSDKDAEEMMGLSTQDLHIKIFSYELKDWLNALKYEMDHNGVVSARAEQFSVDPPAIEAWQDVVSNDEYVSAYDKGVDGYVVKPRIPGTGLRNCWVFYYLGKDINLAWLDNQGRTCVIYNGMFRAENSEQYPGIYQRMNQYGVWPVRDGYLPTPSPGQIVERTDRD